MPKVKVLFVCIHNSARSQMAEAFLNHLAGDKFQAQSAGLEPGELNPMVVEVMQELRMDISHQPTKSVAQFLEQDEQFDYVITVCDEASAEKCPHFPGPAQRLHWSFPDPSNLQIPMLERFKKTREIRDQIKFKIQEWIACLS